METTQDSATPATHPLERRIDLTVSAADIEQEVAQELKRIAKTAKMPGFRPGKVPAKLLAQAYGSQARTEAIGNTIEKALGAAIRDQNLRIVGQPRIEPKAAPDGAADAGQMMFTAIFEVFPEFEIATISDKEIEKPVLVVTDVEIDKTIEALRKQRVTYAPAARPAMKGDRIVIDFSGRKDGEAFEGGTASDYPVLVGAGTMLPDFDAALEGVGVGEEKRFDVNFPEDYHAAHLAGQTVEFVIHVKSVEAPCMPEVDADFARALGVPDGDLVKMRAEVRGNLEREVAKRLKSRIKDQAMEILFQAHGIAVPQVMVEAEARQMAENVLNEMKSRNPQLKSMAPQPEWFIPEATRRVKLGIIIAELVRARSLHAKPDQVRAVVDEFAATFEDPKEVVRWYYSHPDQLARAESLAMENNVVDWVLANVRVTEKAVDLDTLMGGSPR